MISLNRKQSAYLFIILMAALITSRGHHFDVLFHLPDATLAVFFLAGLYLRSPWFLGGFFMAAGLTDYLVIQGGVSSFCVTQGYVLLIPTYLSMWIGGRWFQKVMGETMVSLGYLAGIFSVATFTAFLLSSGGFYLLSGYFPHPSFLEFAGRIVKYFPGYIAYTGLYVVLSVPAHILAMRLSVRYNEK